MRAIRPESSFRTMLGPRRLRLRLVLFLVRIWLLNAWPALNLPDAVLRNRLAAARLVLILGMTQLLKFVLVLNQAASRLALSILLDPACFSLRCRKRVPNFLLLLLRRHHHHHLATLETRKTL